MLQHGNDGAEKAFAVKEEAQFFHIFPVEPGLYLNGQFVPPVDLRPARQAGAHVVGAVFVPLGNQVKLIPQGRPGADDGHFSRENLKNLGQLVQG